ncbi:HNH endonuclease [Streptomyces sp. NBC_01020]|nr:HNH endonuclease [Streptomyces sp. NBC_01020]
MSSSNGSPKKIYFGPPPGVVEGQTFASHNELYAKNVHRQRGAGISGTAAEGVDSIVASGGYAADEDHGDIIIYTARGGDRDKSGHITKDQELTGSNAGLVLNFREGLPIRFVRGLGIVSGKARKGYEYAGLYHVDDYWGVRTARGHLMWQYRLVKDDIEDPLQAATGVCADPDTDDSTELERSVAKYISTQRRVRNTKHVRAIKALYGNACQMCRTTLAVGLDGATYSEGAHIHALGAPHLGPDEPDNILSLCPNCHVLFDNGARLITDRFEIVDGLTQQIIGDLYVKHDVHKVKRKYLRAHRRRWADRSGDLGDL